MRYPDTRIRIALCGQNAQVGRSGRTPLTVSNAKRLNLLGVGCQAAGSPFVKRSGMRASALVVLYILIAAAVSSCSAPAAAEKPARSVPDAIPQDDGVVHIREASRPFIVTESVSGARSGASVSAPARVDFRDGAVSQLGAPLDGRIVKVDVQIGQRVSEGDPLLTLDCPDAAEMRAAVASRSDAVPDATAARTSSSRRSTARSMATSPRSAPSSQPACARRRCASRWNTRRSRCGPACSGACGSTASPPT